MDGGAALLGRESSELKGKNIAAVFPMVETGLLMPDGMAAHPAAASAAPESPSSADCSTPMTRREFSYRRPGGSERTLGISVSPLIVPGTGTVGAVYNFQDLTDDKRREAEYRAKDRMATLGRLSAAIAHEIRNPLASIAGSVKLLESLAELNEDRAKLIAIVSRESDRLNKLIEGRG